ncbi:hypothetical protein GCM10010436_93770 [Paractinoplanes durhamensis]
MGEVAATVREQWGDRLPSVRPGPWQAVGEALAAGDFQAAIRALVRRNEEFTALRGGGLPWVQITDQDGFLLRPGPTRLLAGAQCPQCPTHPWLRWPRNPSSELFNTAVITGCIVVRASPP